MQRTILVPLDGSPLSERALPYATSLASARGARLLLVRAALTHGGAKGNLTREEAKAVREAETYLTGISARVGNLAVVEAVTFSGGAADAIVDEARLRKADCIVMSTHGRTGLGRWIYGSVADAVMRRAEVPVLLVPAGCERSWREQGSFAIVIPLDGSPLAEEALAPTRALGEAVGAKFHLVRIIQPLGNVYGSVSHYEDADASSELSEARRYLDAVANSLREDGRAVTTHVIRGDPASAIADLARESDADLIAMATHGHGGLARLVMGSVATGVVQRASVPTLVVRPVAVRATVSAVAPS